VRYLSSDCLSVEINLGHRRCPRDPSKKNDAGGTPAS
jgi:hypothetical protein